MEIPTDRPTFELSGSTLWVGPEGIVYSKAKPDAPAEQSKEEISREMQKWREILGDKKVCLVAESNVNTRPPKKELRDYIAAEIESIAKAMAIVTSSPLSRMIANLFFSFKPPSYPVKFFTNEKDATEWIRQYL